MANSKQDLHAAARSGDVVAVQTIISSNPPSVNFRDKHRRTPLHLAAWAGHTQVVNILCKNKADIGKAAIDDMGAIHFAAQKGHLDVVKLLVSSGVSVKSANRKGMTALHYAVQGSYIDLIKYLVKKGANVNLKNKAGKSAVDLASNEEIRLLLTSPSESQQTKEKSKETDKNGTEDQESREDEKQVKRKVEGDEVVNVDSKKKKVALNHLLTSDDTQEDEE